MILDLYYTIKPLLPRMLQIFLRRQRARIKWARRKSLWPIDTSAGVAPASWQGWPEGKKFALVLNHDVDTQRGHDHVFDLITVEKRLGFRSAFSFVPERYALSMELIDKVKAEGFEVGIHGLKHDGKLFKSKKVFEKSTFRINQYIDDWKVDHFTAPSMISKLEWIHKLNVTHCSCTFDTDPFEPQQHPSRTIFPFIVKDETTGSVFVELPYTLPQDHGLFVILQEKDNSIWEKKCEWIAEKGGMVLLNTHPDYMQFDGMQPLFESYPIHFYTDFLECIRSKFEGMYWHALPCEVAAFVLSTR